MSQIFKLSNNLFTPLQRTPWGGKNILKNFKDELYPDRRGEIVGESWEFSCDPDFPSTLLDSNQSLMQFFYDHDLGECQLLVKLLNADAPLSLQVHPEDHDTNLMPNECGKPESWLILDAEPGSGLYLGFSKPLEIETLREALSSGKNCRDLLQFVPVKPGDFFDIAPHVPHAIGPGVTLLEPQRVLAGKSGKTYRMWDWGRKYDSEGKRDDTQGKPRKLHLEESLRIVDPKKQVGMSYVKTLLKIPNITQHKNGNEIASYPDNGYYRVVTIKMNPESLTNFSWKESYAFMMVLSGGVIANHQKYKKCEPTIVNGNKVEIKSSGHSNLVLIMQK